MRFLLLDCNLGVVVTVDTLDTPDLVLERVFIVDSINVERGYQVQNRMTVLYWCVVVWEKHHFFPARDSVSSALAARGSLYDL